MNFFNRSFGLFIATILVVILVFSSISDGTISVYSLLSNLAESSTLTASSADVFFQRVYEVPTEFRTYEITDDWGAFNFLRLPLSALVRVGYFFLDLGNYVIWFVNGLWTALIYFVNLVSLVLGF